MQIKFMYNGIKIDGKLYKGHWSNGPWITGVEENVTFYRSEYGRMPNIGVEVENNTDIQTDYFEQDRIRFNTKSKFYSQAVSAFNVQAAHREAKHQRRLLKQEAN